MFKHLSGDLIQSTITNQVLQLVADYCAQQERLKRKPTMEGIISLCGFRFPMRGVYRFTLTTNVADGTVSVFNGECSYVDWLATIRLNQVIVRGVDVFTDHVQAAKGFDSTSA